MLSSEIYPTSLQTRTSSALDNEQGVIDLASIMVGVIVIGLIGGVVAATVFSVIPWAQDHAAKQQLSSIITAEKAHMGLSSDPSSTLPSTSRPNSYADSVELEAAGLLKQGLTYCVVETPDGQSFNAYSKSASGKIFTATAKNSGPEIFTGTLPAECSFIASSDTTPAPTPTPTATPAPIAITPTVTQFTYRCDSTTSGTLPVQTNLNGKESWSDGTTQTYSGESQTALRTMNAGVTYVVTFEGTYREFHSTTLNSCLRSMDYWGEETGVIDASDGFRSAINLVSVPTNIPSTVTNTNGLFHDAHDFNDPNVSQWNVANVTTMARMFQSAHLFNQPLNNWNISKVTDTSLMFAEAWAFNQPIDSWNVISVTNMSKMFSGATVFNQNLNSWQVLYVTDMFGMFEQATAYNGQMLNWNTARVTNMSYMFQGATSFNQNINNWNVTAVLDMNSMFQGATSFNQPMFNWNPSQVRIMTSMFHGATAFNADINQWNVSNVTNMNSMFYGNSVFAYNLSYWNTASLTDGANFAPSTFPVEYLPAKTSRY